MIANGMAILRWATVSSKASDTHDKPEPDNQSADVIQTAGTSHPEDIDQASALESDIASQNFK